MAVLLCGAWPARAQPRHDLVKARLLADVSAVKPGATFTLGVLYEIEPKWHVYWMNPGESGLPTSVKFQVPDGFTVGEVGYPVPAQFKQPGDVIGYGYHDSLLLTAQVTAPADLPKTSELKFGATTTWLSCHDVCIRGQAKLELILSVAAADGVEPKPANGELFKTWAQRLPVEPGGAAELQKADWSADAQDGQLVLNLQWKKPVKDVELYPAAHRALDVKAVSAKTEGKESRVSVEARVLAGQKLDVDTLPAVVAYTDQSGRRHGVKTSIPLAALKGGSAKEG